MERHFDEELKKLKAEILKMAALTEEAIHNSIISLKENDEDKARKVIEDDKKIDELELLVEKRSINLLALRQPMAADLRFITTAMKVNSEIERIADIAVNISQRTLELCKHPTLKELIDIPKLSEISKEMVRCSIDAFVTGNIELAIRVIRLDSEADSLRNKICDELMNDYILKDSSTASRAVPLMLVARYLERICDHASYIAEDVIYMIEAKVVRHHPEKL